MEDGGGWSQRIPLAPHSLLVNAKSKKKQKKNNPQQDFHQGVRSLLLTYLRVGWVHWGDSEASSWQNVDILHEYNVQVAPPEAPE